MRVLVCGGRHFDDWNLVVITLNQIQGITHIIHGGASGADSLGEKWALAVEGVESLLFLALWDDLDVPGAIIREGKYGPFNVIAGFQRNQRMIDDGKPDLIIAFPGNKGTADMVKRGKNAGIAVMEI